MRFQLFLLFSISFNFAFPQQNSLNSQEALVQYENTRAAMEATFPYDEVRTYRRRSFSDEQLQTYLSQLFQCMDYIDMIEGNHTLKLDFYLHAGNWFKKIGFLRESINSFQDFLDYYKSHYKLLDTEDRNHYVEMINYSYSMLSQCYSSLKDYPNALRMHKANVKFSESVGQIYYPSALNNYGLFYYWDKHNLDSAKIYFNKAFTITNSSFTNHTLHGSIRDNIADIMVEEGNLQQARKLYSDNFDFYKQTLTKDNVLDIPRMISAGTQLVETNLSLGNINEADAAFIRLDSVVSENKANNNMLSASWLEYLAAKEQLLSAQNKFEEAYKTANERKRYGDSLQEVSDQMDRIWRDELNNIVLDRIALQAKVEKIQSENKIQSQRSKLWVVVASATAVVILLLSLFLRRRQHFINAKNKQLLAEQKLENTKMKVAHLNNEVKAKQRDLSDFALNLTHNQEWAEDLVEKIQNIKNAKTTDRTLLIDELEEGIKNKVAYDTNTADFFERLDKLSNAFYNILTSRFPNLSKNEVRLCSLIRLKIDSRNIANLQNITLASLNTSRYRLRKKLDLSETEDLDTFIQNL